MGPCGCKYFLFATPGMKIICYRIIDQAQAEQPKKDEEASPNRVERWLKKREFLYTVCTGSTHSILRRRAPLLEPMFKQPLIWTYTKGTKAIIISDSACAHMRGCVRVRAHVCMCAESKMGESPLPNRAGPVAKQAGLSAPPWPMPSCRLWACARSAMARRAAASQQSGAVARDAYSSRRRRGGDMGPGRSRTRS